MPSFPLRLSWAVVFLDFFCFQAIWLATNEQMLRHLGCMTWKGLMYVILLDSFPDGPQSRVLIKLSTMELRYGLMGIFYSQGNSKA